MTLFKPIKIKDLELCSNIIYSPLAGCSDLPFRKMVRKYTDSLIFTEMTKAEALARGDKGTFSMLSYTKDMHPIGAQICTSKKEIAGTCAPIIEDLGFDLLDLNCGCPVDKVTKDGSGSALLKNPEELGKIIYEMQKRVSIPITVKIRAGWDEETINAKEVTKIAEQAGASAIFIHGRTRKQGYKGPAIWDYIKDACGGERSILVFANGDIKCRKSAEDVLLQTGADGVLISRVTMGGPHVARTIFEGENAPASPHPLELVEAHVKEIIRYQNPRKALSDIRRVACWYLRERKEYTDLRRGINKAGSVEQALLLIQSTKCPL
ncbi:MAG: tRNA-dihydrouridine synthase B [Chlamydiia bacterium]|nr:tRNA-dihydrouridine synthase B [Chlamydiia bacterium]MCH9618317.1 tRNA-dihydrouridine synthase B [Chlamydiia bacterium]MCH9624190.1 tRNA-dihydrouridine synthase B [Chlamydiia bacterium]